MKNKIIFLSLLALSFNQLYPGCGMSVPIKQGKNRKSTNQNGSTENNDPANPFVPADIKSSEASPEPGQTSREPDEAELKARIAEKLLNTSATSDPNQYDEEVKKANKLALLAFQKNKSNIPRIEAWIEKSTPPKKTRSSRRRT